MHKEDLALSNLQWLICHKTKTNQTKPNFDIISVKQDLTGGSINELLLVLII